MLEQNLHDVDVDGGDDNADAECEDAMTIVMVEQTTHVVVHIQHKMRYVRLSRSDRESFGLHTTMWHE